MNAIRESIRKSLNNRPKSLDNLRKPCENHRGRDKQIKGQQLNHIIFQEIGSIWHPLKSLNLYAIFAHRELAEKLSGAPFYFFPGGQFFCKRQARKGQPLRPKKKMVAQ